MTRLRGFLDLPVFLFYALVAIPVCLIAPGFWERRLDGLARHWLFVRKDPVPADLEPASDHLTP